MSASTLPILTNSALPPDVSHMYIDSDGAVRLGRGGELIEFRFSFMDVPFSATTRQVQSGPIVQLSGEIAPLPYSAEGLVVRRSVMAIIDASQELIYSRLAISKYKTILCVGKAPFTRPATPAELIAAAASVLVEVEPFLQLLAEILPTWPKTPAAL